jgi:2-polyprenyl-3-methyl-5-hydroxy-6-metoxy-1,4-benzoquinol methylase
MLISSENRALNRQLHERRGDYVTSGARWASTVVQIAEKVGAASILDYGAGKGSLARALGARPVRQCDPAVPGIDAPPEPADLVVCTDVLEHVEPERLEPVLDHLRRLTRRALFAAVATRPAKKTLADGRNAHLIQEPAEWWLPRLWPRFRIRRFDDLCGELVMIGVLRAEG